jgi:hypothetical protein
MDVESKFEQPEEYLTSKEAKKALKVQDCTLAHIRNAGGLKFLKRGNSFLYSKDSIDEYKRKRVKPSIKQG